MAGPPKMRLPYAPAASLRLVSNDSGTAQSTGSAQESDAQEESLYRGIAYAPEQWRSWTETSKLGPDALIAGFSMSLDGGQPFPPQADLPAYIWDRQGELSLTENECQLLDCSLENLTIEQALDGKLLTITPKFTLNYHTRAYAAQLGEIRLVSSHRFVADAEGKPYPLLDTEDAGDPVLYLEDPEDTSVIRQMIHYQGLGLKKDYCFDYHIRQPLLRHWPIGPAQGVEVRTVTVLEQYTSYFMQRAVTCLPGTALWVPAYAPVSWGWSLRVEWEQDDWVITRRKLMNPVVGHDGWQLPHWQGNTLNYRGN